MLHEEDRIRIRAHQIWEQQGRPDGLAATHWQMAQAELAMENSLTDPAAPERELANGAAGSPETAAANDGTRTRSRKKPSAVS
jgi:hypothetical protein